MTPSRTMDRWIPLAALLLLLLAVPATAQQQTGDLSGTVTDENDSELPGVTVTLAGSAAPRTAQTDASGVFRFVSLPPGSYQLTAALEGFSTVEYPNLVVAIGSNVQIEIELRSAIEEVITVTAESPLLDERKTTLGTNVSTQELDKIPTARDPWSLLSQAPGVLVDRINVGGNESGQQSNFLGAGSMGKDNTFAVDGVVLTDMAAVGASATYYDFGAFEEVQLTVSSSDVSVATSGVTVNQVTKRGTNEWRASGRFLRTDGDLQSDPVVLPSGLEGNRIESVEEFGADVGGPLWKDHLWIWASYGESDIQNIVVGGQLDRTMLEDFNSKLNFQAGPSNSGVAHFWTNDKLKDGRGAGANRAPETTHDQTTPADIWKVEDTHLVGSNFFITGLYSENDGVFTLSPQGGRDADVYWDADGVLHGSYWDFAQGAKIDQGRLDASYFFNTGEVSHELKFGGGFREQENTSDTVWPRGKMVYSCEAFGCDPSDNNALVQFWRNKSLGVSSTYDSAWVQDTMSFDRWTINAGLRYDKQEIENLASRSPANPELPDLIPDLTFAGNDAGGFDWTDVSPRVGVTYALGEERKTLLRGSYSRYAEQLGQSLAQRVNPLGYAYAAFYFTDANGNLVLDDAERGSLYYYYYYNFDPSNPAAVASTVSVNDPNLEASKTDELTFSIEHAFLPELVGGITLTARNISDIPETRTLVEDASGNIRPAVRTDYVLDDVVSGVLPNGQTASAPVYVLGDHVSSTGGRLFTNGDREQDYLGITFSATKRLSNRWSLRGHFTWSDWDWKIGDEYRFFEDPTDVIRENGETVGSFADGGDVVAEQSTGSGDKKDVWTGARWSFNVNGLYQVAPDRPWGFNVAASITGREGFVSPPFAPVGLRQVQLARDFDQFRNDDIFLIDARIDKDFEFGDFGFTVSLDGFNLLNEDYVLQRETNTGVATVNNVRETLSPRVFRIGVKLNWK